MNEPKNIIGEDVSRLEGRLKVTGAATYSAEYALNRLVYAFPVQSTIAAGTIREMDTSEAERAAGVLAVITHKNAPKLAPRPEPVTYQNRPTRAIPVLQDVKVYEYGQYIGVVVAETYEQARYAARLVKVQYNQQKPLIDFDENVPRAYTPTALSNDTSKPDTAWGNVEQGLQAASQTLDATYQTPIEHHHPMEPHATLAVWEGDTLTLYDSTQRLEAPQAATASSFGLPVENVRVIATYIGGGFGSKLGALPHNVLAAMAARQVARPVKLVLTRQMMQTSVGLRQLTRQHLRLGTTPDGKLTALVHETITHTSVDEEYVEPTGAMSRMMYDVPNSRVTHRVFTLNVRVPRWMRAPGEATGSFALESAMDELAYQLKMDPIAFRLQNEPAHNPEDGKSWSSRSLAQAMRAGADAFGWTRRQPEPRANRQGNWLVGYGMSATARAALVRESSARLTLSRRRGQVNALVELGATDIGTGSYTVITQTAADRLGLPLANVQVKLGDSTLPKTPGSGGSFGTSSYVSSVAAVCDKAMSELRLKAGLSSDQKATVGDLLRSVKLTTYRTEATEKPSAEYEQHANYSFGAHFCEVWVDESLGTVRVNRFVSAMACGTILNPKTASSQVIGGIVWGIGQALTEESTLDPRYGSYVTRTLADYHIPVSLDVGEIEVVFIPETDSVVNRVGVKGIGEASNTGVAAAIANAVFNATGKRIRALPLTPDKLI